MHQHARSTFYESILENMLKLHLYFFCGFRVEAYQTPAIRVSSVDDNDNDSLDRIMELSSTAGSRCVLLTSLWGGCPSRSVRRISALISNTTRTPSPVKM